MDLIIFVSTCSGIKLRAVYKVDDVLIGISVIDILPYCISSVYFIWHPDWAWASLGKLSALHEIALSVEMQKAGLEEMKFLYMGKYPTFTSGKEWLANEQDTGSQIASR